MGRPPALFPVRSRRVAYLLRPVAPFVKTRLIGGGGRGDVEGQKAQPTHINTDIQLTKIVLLYSQLNKTTLRYIQLSLYRGGEGQRGGEGPAAFRRDREMLRGYVERPTSGERPDRFSDGRGGTGSFPGERHRACHLGLTPAPRFVPKMFGVPLPGSLSPLGCCRDQGRWEEPCFISAGENAPPPSLSPAAVTYRRGCL